MEATKVYKLAVVGGSTFFNDRQKGARLTLLPSGWLGNLVLKRAEAGNLRSVTLVRGYPAEQQSAPSSGRHRICQKLYAKASRLDDQQQRVLRPKYRTRHTVRLSYTLT